MSDSEFEPTKGKGMRKLFKKNGYKLYLVNEYNTSKKMYGTGYEMAKFRYRNGKLVHGLIRNKLVTGISSIDSIVMNLIHYRLFRSLIEVGLCPTSGFARDECNEFEPRFEWKSKYKRKGNKVVF